MAQEEEELSSPCSAAGAAKQRRPSKSSTEQLLGQAHSAVLAEPAGWVGALCSALATSTKRPVCPRKATSGAAAPEERQDGSSTAVGPTLQDCCNGAGDVTRMEQ